MATEESPPLIGRGAPRCTVCEVAFDDLHECRQQLNQSECKQAWIRADQARPASRPKKPIETTNMMYGVIPCGRTCSASLVSCAVRVLGARVWSACACALNRGANSYRSFDLKHKRKKQHPRVQDDMHHLCVWKRERDFIHLLHGTERSFNRSQCAVKLRSASISLNLDLINVYLGTKKSNRPASGRLVHVYADGAHSRVCRGCGQA